MLNDIFSVLRAIMARCCPGRDPADWRFEPVSGLSGVNWRAICGDSVTFMLRPENAEKRLLGISRRRELRVLRRLAGQQLAPGVHGIWHGWLVCDWVAGQTPDALPEHERLAALMAKVHRNAWEQPRVDLRRQYEIYWQALDRHRIIPAMLRRHRSLLRLPEPRVSRPVLLHMDVHPANLVATEAGWRLIDWEYAGGGDAALELAALARGNDWSGEQIRAFTAAYCRHGAQAEGALRQRVLQWLPRVDYLMWLWYGVRWQQTRDAHFNELAARVWQRLE